MMYFTIIMPIYNVERRYLSAALDSVLSQSYANFECLCVDDGSERYVSELVLSYSAHDRRIKLLAQAHKGVSEARNRALMSAKGDWVVFLDADDVFHRDALLMLANVINQFRDCQMIRYGVVKFSEDSGMINGIQLSSASRRIDISRTIPPSYYETCAIQFAFHNSIAGVAKFPDLQVGEDRVFYLHCLKHAKIIACTDAKIYGYRQRCSSALHTLPADRQLADSFKYSMESLRIFEDDVRAHALLRAPQLVRFLVHDYVTILVRDVPAHDRAMLWNVWFDALPYLSNSKCFDGVYRLVFKICNLTRLKFVAIVLCSVFLSLAWRIGMPFAHAMNPDLDEA